MRLVPNDEIVVGFPVCADCDAPAPKYVDFETRTVVVDVHNALDADDAWQN